MRKATLILFFLIAVLACKKVEVENFGGCYLKSAGVFKHIRNNKKVVKESTTDLYTYKYSYKNGMLSKWETYTNSELSRTMEFDYEDNKTTINFYEKDGILHMRIIHTLNDEGKAVVVRHEVSHDSKTWKTNETVKYIWANGNVAEEIHYFSSTDSMTYKRVFEYDDKHNPHLTLPFTITESRNNVIKVSQYEANGSQQSTATTYTYNEKGLPIEVTYSNGGTKIRYEYECD